MSVSSPPIWWGPPCHPAPASWIGSCCTEATSPLTELGTSRCCPRPWVRSTLKMLEFEHMFDYRDVPIRPANYRGVICVVPRCYSPRGRVSGAREVREMEREKMLEVTLAQIERQFGKGAVMRLGEQDRKSTRLNSSHV